MEFGLMGGGDEFLSNSSDFDFDLTNLTVIEDLCTPQEPEINTTLMVFRILVCALGIFGNSMVIFVILVLREYEKAVTHWYVLQLAIADTLFLLTIPFKVMEDTHDEWIFSGLMCKAKETMLFLNYYSSMLFLVIMSVNRYIVVCHGFSAKLQKLRNKRAAYIITVIVWAISLMLCIPVMSYSDKRGFDPHCKCTYEFPNQKRTAEEICRYEQFDSSNETLQHCIEREESQSEEYCSKLDCDDLKNSFEKMRKKMMEMSDDSENFSALETEEEMTTNVDIPDFQVYNPGCSYVLIGHGFTAFLTFNFIAMFILPVIIMSVCYCSIAFKLKQAHVKRENSTTETIRKGERKRTESAASAKAERNRIRVTYMCIILVLFFIVCWLPFHAVHLAKMKGISNTDSDFCALIAKVSTFLAYINSCLNPYIYNFIGTRFGKRLSSAAGTVKLSVKKRTVSISSGGGTVRYHKNKQSSNGTSAISETQMTKIYQGTSEAEPNNASSSALDDNKQEVLNPLV